MNASATGKGEKKAIGEESCRLCNMQSFLASWSLTCRRVRHLSGICPLLLAEAANRRSRELVTQCHNTTGTSSPNVHDGCPKIYQTIHNSLFISIKLQFIMPSAEVVALSVHWMAHSGRFQIGQDGELIVPVPRESTRRSQPPPKRLTPSYLFYSQSPPSLNLFLETICIEPGSWLAQELLICQCAINESFTRLRRDCLPSSAQL